MRANLNLRYFFFLAIGAYLFRLSLAANLDQFTVYNDMNAVHIWGINLLKYGPENFYTRWSDYLPGYLYVAWFLASFEQWLISHSLFVRWEILFKLPSIISDIGSSFFIYLIVQKFASQKKAFITSIIFLFNPAFFVNSTLWGQVDSFITFFLFSSFYYLLEGKYIISSILLGFGQLVKPIAIFALPVYLIYMISKKVSFKKILLFLILLVTVVIAAFIPFNNFDNIFRFIIDRHSVTANQYPYTSVNAFNFWSIVTKLWEPDKHTFLDINFQTWGYLLFGSVYLFLIGALFILIKKVSNSTLLLTTILSLIFLGMFIFLTRMHERHIYYGLAFLSLLIPDFNIFSIVLIVILYFIHLINLYYPYSQATTNPLFLSQHAIVFFSVLNFAIFIYFLAIFISKYSKNK